MRVDGAPAAAAMLDVLGADVATLELLAALPSLRREGHCSAMIKVGGACRDGRGPCLHHSRHGHGACTMAAWLHGHAGCLYTAEQWEMGQGRA